MIYSGDIVVGDVAQHVMDSIVYYSEDLQIANKYRTQATQEIILELFDHDMYEARTDKKITRYFETPEKLTKLIEQLPEVYERIINYITKNFPDKSKSTSTFDYWMELYENKANDFMFKVFDFSVSGYDGKVKNFYRLQDKENKSDLCELILNYMVSIGNSEYDIDSSNSNSEKIRAVHKEFLEYKRGKYSTNENITNSLKNNAPEVYDILLEEYGSKDGVTKELQKSSCFSDLSLLFVGKTTVQDLKPLELHYKIINYMIEKSKTIEVAIKYKESKAQKSIVSVFSSDENTAIPKIKIQELRDNAVELYAELTGSEKTSLDDAYKIAYFTNGWKSELENKFSSYSSSKENWYEIAVEPDISDLAKYVVETMVNCGHSKYKNDLYKSVMTAFEEWKKSKLWS